MKIILVTCLFLLLNLFADAQGGLEEARKGIRQLHEHWNKARLSRDRRALEYLFATEYQWVHGFGYIDDRTAVINDQLNTDTLRPVPLPDLTNLELYGDVAILRERTASPISAMFSTAIYKRQKGRWQFFFDQTTLLQPERKFIALHPDRLPLYTGRYKNKGRLLSVNLLNDTLQLKTDRWPRRSLFAIGEDKFMDKVGSVYQFFKTADGKVTHITILLPTREEAVWYKEEK